MPSFDISPRDKWERLASTPTSEKEVFNDASRHLSTRNKVCRISRENYCAGKPHAGTSPKEKEQRKKEIERCLYEVFSKYGDRFP